MYIYSTVLAFVAGYYFGNQSKCQCEPCSHCNDGDENALDKEEDDDFPEENTLLNSSDDALDKEEDEKKKIKNSNPIVDEEEESFIVANKEENKETLKVSKSPLRYFFYSN